MRALHRATLSLYEDLSLEGTLRRIVRAARELTHARYAALGIPDGKGGLETFLTEGLTDEEVARIPHPPVGHGLIGELMRTGRSLRVPEIARHPRSTGFPEGHPPMRSFLGVPISAYGRPVGQIYLTDRLGAGSFTEEDQNLAELLAAHAAAALENARLFRQVREREAELAARNRELEVVNSLNTAVGSAVELEPLLQGILDRVMGLFEAQAGEVFIRSDDADELILAVHRGMAGEAFWEQPRFRIGEGFVGDVARRGRALWTSDLAGQAEPHFLRQGVIAAGFGALVSVPLKARARVVGVMSLAFRGQRRLDPSEIELLEALGAGVGVAVENARLYRQARRVAVLEERERIAMELHDGIIQSIYAVGLMLDSAKIQLPDPSEAASSAIREAIERMNDVIRDIRAYILDLQPSRAPADDLPAALERLVNEFRANTMVEAELLTDPSAAQGLAPEVRMALFHISQEALANAAKHARASRVWLSLRADAGEVVLQVIDNGRGFAAGDTTSLLGHGLSNMAERGRAIGAHVAIDSAPGEGTTVTVRLPQADEPASP
jgi:signal transduction histidine kinase